MPETEWLSEYQISCEMIRTNMVMSGSSRLVQIEVLNFPDHQLRSSGAHLQALIDNNINITKSTKTAEASPLPPVISVKAASRQDLGDNNTSHALGKQPLWTLDRVNAHLLSQDSECGSKSSHTQLSSVDSCLLVVDPTY